MYGLVNKGIKDLVLNRFGEDVWNDICKEANVPNDYVSMQYYPDEVTYRLVGAASQKLNISPEDILKTYGTHWVAYTGKEGFGPIMDLFGADLKSCLQNLNHLHTRMGMTMPQLRPPSFNFIEISEKEFKLEYISERKGLNPMVIGLIHGLASKFKVEIKIDHLPEESSDQKQIFKILVIGDI